MYYTAYVSHSDFSNMGLCFSKTQPKRYLSELDLSEDFYDFLDQLTPYQKHQYTKMQWLQKHLYQKTRDLPPPENLTNIQDTNTLVEKTENYFAALGLPAKKIKPYIKRLVSSVYFHHLSLDQWSMILLSHLCNEYRSKYSSNAFCHFFFRKMGLRCSKQKADLTQTGLSQDFYDHVEKMKKRREDEFVLLREYLLLKISKTPLPEEVENIYDMKAEGKRAADYFIQLGFPEKESKEFANRIAVFSDCHGFYIIHHHILESWCMKLLEDVWEDFIRRTE